MAERFNPFMSKEFEGFMPGGIPQYEMVAGVRRRNWVKPKKGPRLPGKPDPLNPKKSAPRYAFAQMYETPLGVGYYGGNRRMPNGQWMIRVRWDERDPSQGWTDFQLTKIKPVWRLSSGDILPCVWREEGHTKTQPKKVKIIAEMVEADVPKPQVGLAVIHRVFGPGVVQSVSGTHRDWYANVRYESDPFGPLESLHEYSVEVFYGDFFEHDRPEVRRTVRYRNPSEPPPADMGASVVSIEDARARQDRDLTEFVVGDDGKIRRHTVNHKRRAKPSGACIPSTFLRESEIIEGRS